MYWNFDGSGDHYSWTGGPDTTIRAEPVRGDGSKALRVAGPVGSYAQSEGTQRFPHDAYVAAQFLADSAPRSPQPLVVSGANDIVAIKVNAFAVHVSDGLSPSGNVIWRYLGPSREMWQSVSIQLRPTTAIVTLDGLAPVEVARTSLEEPRRLVARPDGTELWLDLVRIHDGPPPLDADFLDMPPWDVTLSPDTNMSFLDVGYRSAGALRLRGSAMPDTHAYGSVPASALGDQYFLHTAIRAQQNLPYTYPDHMAALAGLDEDGDVVWAVTMGPYPSLHQLGLWLVVPSTLHVEPLVHGGEHSNTWHDLIVRVDVPDRSLGIHANGDYSRGAYIEALPDVRTIAIGDVWGAAPTGAAVTWHDLVIASPMALIE